MCNTLCHYVIKVGHPAKTVAYMKVDKELVLKPPYWTYRKTVRYLTWLYCLFPLFCLVFSGVPNKQYFIQAIFLASILFIILAIGMLMLMANLLATLGVRKHPLVVSLESDNVIRFTRNDIEHGEQEPLVLASGRLVRVVRKTNKRRSQSSYSLHLDLTGLDIDPYWMVLCRQCRHKYDCDYYISSLSIAASHLADKLHELFCSLGVEPEVEQLSLEEIDRQQFLPARLRWHWLTLSTIFNIVIVIALIKDIVSVH